MLGTQLDKAKTELKLSCSVKDVRKIETGFELILEENNTQTNVENT